MMMMMIIIIIIIIITINVSNDVQFLTRGIKNDSSIKKLQMMMMMTI